MNWKKGDKDFFILLKDVISFTEKRLGLQYFWGHGGRAEWGTGAFGELYVPLKKPWLRRCEVLFYLVDIFAVKGLFWTSLLHD